MTFGWGSSGWGSFGWHQGPSLVARLLAMRALRAETQHGTVFLEAETEHGTFHLKAETDGHD